MADEGLQDFGLSKQAFINGILRCHNHDYSTERGSEVLCAGGASNCELSYYHLGLVWYSPKAPNR